MSVQMDDQKINNELMRKLQTKLKKQRQDLQRSHQFELQQKLKEQSEKYEKEVQSLNKKLQSTVQITKLKQKKELNTLRYSIHIFIKPFFTDSCQ